MVLANQTDSNWSSLLIRANGLMGITYGVPVMAVIFIIRLYIRAIFSKMMIFPSIRR